jgi:hypothetical protein
LSEKKQDELPPLTYLENQLGFGKGSSHSQLYFSSVTFSVHVGALSLYQEEEHMRVIAIALGTVASLIGIFSTISAISVVGGDPAYSFRLWAGWASLVLAILAGIAAILITTRPRAASLTMLISGMLGFVCINLYYIDTFYMVAVQLWIIATLLAWVSTTTSASEKVRGES